ncbi:hypothetical protein [Celeribacter sp.]|uniref:hypothetical protein n=1 Tax=Celeribacter sp. TaxID=1890673 RepID=UPI003A930863
MTSMHDHTPLDAVDALFELRAQMARLRDLEAELCDEIRSFATEIGGGKVFGASRVAVIETRTPTRVDPAKLPHAILSDPHFFATEKETVVLLWPRAAVAQAAISAPVVPPMPMQEESAIQPPQEVEATAEDIMADETEAFEGPDHEEAFPSEDISLGVAEPGPVEMPLTDVTENAPVEMRTIGVPLEEKDDSITEMYDLEESVLAASDGSAPVDPAIPEVSVAPDAFVNADDPFGLKTASSQEAVMAADMPLIDAHDAVEGETPKDLRPTEHAHLQPLAGLPDEDMAQMTPETEVILTPATLPDALDIAQALEAQADQLADLPSDVAQAPRASVTTDFEGNDLIPATAFSSRRIAVGGET